MCHYSYFDFSQSLQNVKPILRPQAVHKQVMVKIWPTGYILPILAQETRIKEKNNF